MKQKLSILLLCSIFSQSVSAQDTALVRKGDLVPFDGILFSEKKANEVRYQLIKLDNLEKINESYDKTIVLYKKNEDYKNEQLSVLLQRNDDLAKSLQSSQTTSNWERILWFTLGVVATTGAVYGAGKVLK